MVSLAMLSLIPGGLKGCALAQSCMQAQERLAKTPVIFISLAGCDVFHRYRIAMDVRRLGTK